MQLFIALEMRVKTASSPAVREDTVEKFKERDSAILVLEIYLTVKIF